MPNKANEISGLLIMGVSGGAIVPPILGITADYYGQSGAIFCLIIGVAYLFYNAFIMLRRA